MTVPSLVLGTDVVAAYAVMHRLGLRVEFTKPVDISSLVPGTITYTPAGGTSVPRGSTIEITPSLGPSASPAVSKSSPRYPVPNLVGCTVGRGTAWADDHNLYWSIPALPSPGANTASHLFDAYRIVSQRPKPGAMLGQGFLSGRTYHPTPLTLMAEAIAQ
ncbi:MAG: PASTA domain-containing protein [Mycobacteriales bacterium]